MTVRWMMATAFASLFSLAAWPASGQEQVKGVVADPCTVKTAPGHGTVFAGDFAQLCQYRAQNAALMKPGSTPPRVVFMGDSITEFWGDKDAAFFANGKIDRGISGQTTSQMLLRFRQDVIELHPQEIGRAHV